MLNSREKTREQRAAVVTSMDIARAINGASELYRESFTSAVHSALEDFLLNLRAAKAVYDKIADGGDA